MDRLFFGAGRPHGSGWRGTFALTLPEAALRDDSSAFQEATDFTDRTPIRTGRG
jgi:hypothetical protein